MENTVDERVKLLAAAWREFQTCVPVKLDVIESEQQYGAMVDFMNELLDVAGDQEAHPVSGLLHLVPRPRDFDRFTLPLAGRRSSAGVGHTREPASRGPSHS